DDLFQFQNKDFIVHQAGVFKIEKKALDVFADQKVVVYRSGRLVVCAVAAPENAGQLPVVDFFQNIRVKGHDHQFARFLRARIVQLLSRIGAVDQERVVVVQGEPVFG